MKFEIHQKVVVPTHGIGTIIDIKEERIMGMITHFYVVEFEESKILINIPVQQAEEKGLRKIVNRNQFSEAIEILKTKPFIPNKVSWNKKSQYYMSKMNSGEVSQIAEVIRDISKNIYKKKSYKEEIILKEAIARLSSELAIQMNVSVAEAERTIEENLYIQPKITKNDIIQE